jgi:hypothetical protein
MPAVARHGHPVWLFEFETIAFLADPRPEDCLAASAIIANHVPALNEESFLNIEKHCILVSEFPGWEQFGTISPFNESVKILAGYWGLLPSKFDLKPPDFDYFLCDIFVNGQRVVEVNRFD